MLLSINENIYSQRFGLNLGVIRNYNQYDLPNSKYSLLLEISFSGVFYSNKINWEFAYGYVDDGLNESEINDNGQFYNNVDYSIASRFIFNLDSFLTGFNSTKIITGFSYHFVNSEFVYPKNFALEITMEDIKNERVYFDIGLEYKITEIWGIDIIPRYLAIVPLWKNGFLTNNVKHSLIMLLKF